METTVKINVADYVTENEIKEIVQDEIRKTVQNFFADEKNAQRLLSNLSYQIVFDEVDKIVPDCRNIIKEKTLEIINKDSFSYNVFRQKSYGSPNSLAYDYIEQTVKECKDMINQKVKDTIINHDYSDEIWRKFEELGETFISNIYSIVELGKKPKS